MRQGLFLALLLLAVSGCGDDPPPAPARAPEIKKAPEPPARRDVTHELGPSASGKEKTIIVGDRVLVELPGPSQGVAPEYRFAWGEPTVTGDAVRYVNREDRPPPEDVDGGRFTHVFELRAARAGRSTITIPVKDKGKAADATTYTIDFVVALPD
jgi:hypothetical protein